MRVLLLTPGRHLYWQARLKKQEEEEQERDKSRQAKIKKDEEEEQQRVARDKSRQAKIRTQENEREALKVKKMRQQALVKQQLKDEQTRKENEQIQAKLAQEKAEQKKKEEQRLAKLTQEKAEQKKKEEQRLARLALEEAQQKMVEEQRLAAWRRNELIRLEAEEKAAFERRQKEKEAKALQAKYDLVKKHPLIWRPYVGKLKQGDRGLQQELSANLRLNDLTAEKVRLACSKTREQFAFQRVLDCLVRPGSPVVRALVQFPAGTGKTRCAVNVFNNYFYDLRPKIFFVPKPALVSNFYRELFKSDNKYREFILTYFAGKNWSNGTRTYYQHRSRSSNNEQWRWTCSSCALENADSPMCIRCNAVEPQAFGDAIDQLEMKGSIGRGPDENAFLTGGLPAPIRAVAYRNGGSASAIKNLTVLNFAAKVRARTLKTSSSSSASAGAGPKSPYSDCIIVCDEIHELFDSHGDTGDVKNLEALQTHLRNASNAVFVVMTATPVSSIATMEREKDRLMALVKGNVSATTANEGYVFSFSAFHPALFLNTCNCLAMTVKVPVQGANLKYLLNVMLEKAKPGATPKQNKALKHKLRNACNQANPSAFSKKGPWPKQLATDAASQATKLARIVRDVASRPNEKTLVMVHRSEGFRSLLVTLKSMFNEAGVQWASFKSTADEDVVVSGQITASTLLGGKVASPTRSNQRRRRLQGDSKGTDKPAAAAKRRQPSAYETNLQDFNSYNPTVHPYGSDAGKNKIRVLVVDAQMFTSGVSFFGVQRLVLVNPPQSYMDYKQQIGRPLRACESHMNLPEYMRRLHIDMYVAVLPDLETCVQALGKSKKLVALLRSKAAAALTTPDEDSAAALDSEKDKVVDFLQKNFEDLAIDKGVYSFNNNKQATVTKPGNKAAANQQQDGFWATVDFVKKWVKEKAVDLAGKAAKLARSAVAK